MLHRALCILAGFNASIHHMQQIQSNMGRRPVRRLALAAAVAVAAAAPAAHGLTGTWNFNGSDVWSNASRWNPAPPPDSIPTSAGDIANITFNITGTRTVTIDG